MYSCISSLSFCSFSSHKSDVGTQTWVKHICVQWTERADWKTIEYNKKPFNILAQQLIYIESNITALAGCCECWETVFWCIHAFLFRSHSIAFQVEPVRYGSSFLVIFSIFFSSYNDVLTLRTESECYSFALSCERFSPFRISTLWKSLLWNHTIFFSCDEKSHDFSCEKCVPCDFTRENCLPVMKNYTIFHVIECMRKWSNFYSKYRFFPRPNFL